MTVTNNTNTTDNYVSTQDFLASKLLKDNFKEWLAKENNKSSHCERVVEMLENSSVLFLKFKLSLISIWEITSVEEFRLVRNKALEHKIFLVLTGRKSIKFFNQCCDLFHSYLITNPPLNNLKCYSENLKASKHQGFKTTKKPTPTKKYLKASLIFSKKR